MTISTQAIQKLRTLRADAKTLATAEERYRAATAPTNVDKHAFRFSASDRSAVFCVDVALEAYSGTYGSSSVYTMFGMHSDKTEVSKHFLAALNVHRNTILQTMAKLMDKSADELKSAAEREIEALQSLIKEPLAADKAEAI